MEEKIFNISFESVEKKYTGWVNPSERLDHDGNPVSFHVVLNNIFFGELSLSHCRWNINESRPHQLVEAAGKEIEKYYKL
jgi:hypothetical protein